MSDKELLCPWRMETFIRNSHSINSPQELASASRCLNESCAKWGVIQIGASMPVDGQTESGCRMYSREPDVYGCTR